MGKPRVLGYVRVSTAEQVDGFGLTVQEKAIRAYCRSTGLQLVAILSDEGQSGSNGLDTRHGLAEGLARIEAGEVSGLVVYRLDRLARDFVLQETIYQRLTQKGVQIFSVKEPVVDGDVHLQDMVRQILGVIGQYEKAIIKGRLMAGKAEKVASGGYGGGRPAYGHMADNRALVVNPSETAIISTVTTMRQQGASYRQIIQALDDAGLATRSGGAWNPNQIRRIAQRAGVE